MRELPPAVRELAQIVAQVVAAKRDRSPEEVGEAVALMVCRHFAGCEIRLPSPQALARMERAEYVRQLAQAGLGPTEIARRVGLSRQRVHRILSCRKSEKKAQV